MFDSRRQLLKSSLSCAAFLSFSSRLFAQQQPAHPQFHPYPNVTNPSFPNFPDDNPNPKPSDQKATIDNQNQQQIRADIDRMSAILSELKQELTATNTVSTLSVNFVKKAQELEKLAKHFKGLARG